MIDLSDETVTNLVWSGLTLSWLIKLEWMAPEPLPWPLNGNPSCERTSLPSPPVKRMLFFSGYARSVQSCVLVKPRIVPDLLPVSATTALA